MDEIGIRSFFIVYSLCYTRTSRLSGAVAVAIPVHIDFLCDGEFMHLQSMSREQLRGVLTGNSQSTVDDTKDLNAGETRKSKASRQNSYHAHHHHPIRRT